MHQEHKTTRTKNKPKQLKSPGLVASYNLQPGNTVHSGPILKGKGK